MGEADTEVRSEDPTDDTTGSWWKSTWPLDRSRLLQLAIALVVVVAAFVAVGEALTNLGIFDGIVAYDEQLATDLAEGRTETKNDLAHWGSFLSDTPVKIVASTVIAGLLLWRLRRWREAVLIGLSLIFEATAYIVTSYIVQRPRPDVERLLESPVDTTWPSGHVAAATVYGALVFIVLWHTTSRTLRVLAVVLASAVPLVVGWARMYQGMHFLSDVVGGIVLGVVSVLVCRRILNAPADAKDVVFDDRVAPEEDAA